MSFFKQPTVSPKALQDEISSNLEETFTAGENITLGKALVSLLDGQVIIARSDDPTHFGKFVGIAASTALSGNQVAVKNNGEFLNEGWNFTSVGNVFYNENGDVTQTCPSAPLSNHCQIIGTNISQKKVVINQKPAVYL